jgi:hypothetical protein
VGEVEAASAVRQKRLGLYTAPPEALAHEHHQVLARNLMDWVRRGGSTPSARVEFLPATRHDARVLDRV